MYPSPEDAAGEGDSPYPSCPERVITPKELAWALRGALGQLLVRFFSSLPSQVASQAGSRLQLSE